ncbi:MAG: radical SAM protein [Magnetococcales bacterium]|nr:radical SAM protein [Magnetococcales bacterium]
MNKPFPSSLRIVMIQPASYDDEGYVIQFWRVFNTNYTLSAIQGLLRDAAGKRDLDASVTMEIWPIDESCELINRDKLIQWLQQADRSLVMMVGVLSAHYPRAVDLADLFIKQQIPVMIGGFHVSACLSTTPDWSPCLQSARDVGASLFAGELEGFAEQLLDDIWLDQIKPLYNRLDHLPDLLGAAPPYLDHTLVKRMATPVAGVELGRGCPYKCTFCCIINVFGNKYRSHSAEETAEHFRQCAKSGVIRFTLVDDNLSRNPQWRVLFQILAKLREEEGLSIDFFMQIDTRAHKLSGFVEGARRAGCSRVFIGIESVRDGNLTEDNKRTCAIDDLRDMALAWKRVGIMVYGGYIIGMHHDTPETVAEDMQTLQNELAIDSLHLSILTPLPGSINHQRMLAEGVPLNPDFNFYDGIHALTPHPNMSEQVWEQLYNDAWSWLFSGRFIRRVFRRALVSGLPIKEIFGLQLLFSGSIPLERLSPLEGGIWRHKVRTDRRPGLPIESIWRFYPRRVWEIVKIQLGGWGGRFVYLHLLLLQARIQVWMGGVIDDPAMVSVPEDEGKSSE